MHSSLSEVARYSAVGIFEANVAVSACRCGVVESTELAVYMQSAEFNERAERLKLRICATLESGKPVLARDVAAELQLPLHLAVALLERLGIPLDHTIIGESGSA